MNTQQHNNKKPEVYSISGFKDTLASPVFYPVVVVSLVLGITSIFGFVQNPLKLKNVVSVIQQKVAESNVVSDSFSKQQYVVADIEQVKFHQSHRPMNKSYQLFSGFDSVQAVKKPIAGDFERLAFNYDVTSESFWTDLDSSNLETFTEEMERKEREAFTIGAPLQLEHHESYPTKLNEHKDSIYALNRKN